MAWFTYESNLSNITLVKVDNHPSFTFVFVFYIYTVPDRDERAGFGAETLVEFSSVTSCNHNLVWNYCTVKAQSF